jgi:hypothetical protein
MTSRSQLQRHSGFGCGAEVEVSNCRSVPPMTDRNGSRVARVVSLELELDNKVTRLTTQPPLIRKMAFPHWSNVFLDNPVNAVGICARELC